MGGSSRWDDECVALASSVRRRRSRLLPRSATRDLDESGTSGKAEEREASAPELGPFAPTAYARSAMEPHRPAHRRESAQVYRLRRAVAATVAVLMLFLLLNLTGVVGGDGGDEVAATT